METGAGGGNAERFRGFAEVYDASRPAPPVALGPLLARYAGVGRPAVVDLGSGTGLSSRWAAPWAASVTGIEPSDDMRAVALARPAPGVSYRAGVSHRTGLDPDSADVVVAVQAMHWMEPASTLAEVARILRPGGVFAAVDADWPPVAGVARAERAWMAVFRRLRVFEARAARGEAGDLLVGPVADDDPALVDEDPLDAHRNRVMPGGARSWSKSSHLQRIASSGHFAFAREVVMNQEEAGGPERFVALLRSQGSYQGLHRMGLDDAVLGVADFEREVHDAFADAAHADGLSFVWRVRLGVTPRARVEP